MDFTLHTTVTAPEASKALLENSQQAFGMIPNLHAVMAESPQVLEAYQNLHQLFSQTRFNHDELTVVWQTINIEHGCHYCIPAHNAIAKLMAVDDDIITALKNGTPMPSIKLQMLHLTTLALVRQRGRLTEQQLTDFASEGYQQGQLLEIVLGIAQKVLSNYINHLANTPIDSAFLVSD